MAALQTTATSGPGPFPPVTTPSVSTSSLQAAQAALHALPMTSHPRPLTQHCARPLPNSYWATPLLLATEYPYAPGATTQKLDALLAAGVRTFIDLTEPGELQPYCARSRPTTPTPTPQSASFPFTSSGASGSSSSAACSAALAAAAADALDARAAALGISPAEIEYHNFPIHDRSLPPSHAFMADILRVLAHAEARGRIAAVHCRGGIGRTGMVVGCWLVQRGSARDGAHALQLIAAEWATVEKCTRFPCSPETGPQFEFVRTWRQDKRVPAVAVY